MSQVEVLGLLAEQEVACRAEADRLRAEAERIAILLAERESELVEIATACKVVGRLSAGAPGVARAVAAATVPAPRDAGSLSHGEIDERISGVLAKYPGAVRAGQVAAELGLEVSPRQVERVRHALKRAAARGLVLAVPGGAFALKR